MLKLKKHHTLLVIMVVLFVLAWSIWTFIMLPASETPSFPNPAEPAPGIQPGQ